MSPNYGKMIIEHHNYGGELTYQQIVDKYNLPFSSEALRKKVKRGTIIPDFDNSDFDNEDTGYGVSIAGYNELNSLRREIQRLKTALQSGNEPDEEELMYTAYPPHLDDTPKWEDWKMAFNTRKRMMKVCFFFDIHVPDHSHSALDLAYQITDYVQPDVVLYGGDMFDFDSLSTFAKSRFRRRTDAMKEIKGSWHNIVSNVSKVAPHARQIAMRGNHDTRLERWNAMISNPFAETIEEDFVTTVRSNNQVWWLGQLQETNIIGLFAQHGKRVGESAAKNALKDMGWSVSVIQGHNHRPATYIHRAAQPTSIKNYKVIYSVSSGALCNIPPHYQIDTDQSTWLNGMAIAHVDTVDQTVNIQNVVFNMDDNGRLWAAFGDNIFREKA